MKAPVFLFVIGCWVVSIGGAAQCPDRATVYNKLQIIEGLTDRHALIQAATQLSKECQRCRITNDSVYAKLLHVLGRAYWKEGDLPRAFALTRQAIAVNSVRSSVTREANLANSYTNLGLILTDQGNYISAQKAFTESIRLASRYPDKFYVGAMALEKQATLYYEQGDYAQARQTAEQGFLLAQRANNPVLMVQNQSQQVQALLELREYSTAESILKTAVPMAQSLDNPKLLASILSLTANLHQVQKQYSTAIQDYQHAFETNRQASFRYGCAQTLINLGYLYQVDLKEPRRALQLYQQALAYMDDPNGRALVINNIGDIYKSRKEYKQALAFFQQALQTHAIGFKANNPLANPTSNAIRLIAEKDYLYTLVRNKADTWLDWAKSTGNNPTRLRNAQKTYALADSMIDFMRWEHTGQQSKLFWRDKTHRLYESAIETCFRLNDAANAFRFIEKSRAVLLNDKLNELGANRQLTPSQVAEEQRLRQRVTDWQSKLSGEKPGTSIYTKALDSLRSTQEAQETFVHQLERTNPIYYRYKYNNDVISLAQVQQQLAKPKASLVTYFVGDSSLYALGITPTSTKLLHLSAPAYTKQASELLALNANPEAQNEQFTHYLTVSNQLYQQLLKPLALAPGRVIVSPDGVLLPFETLSTSAIRPDFLVRQYAFSYAYSLNQLFKETPSPSGHWFNRPQSFLGMAPVQFSASLNQVSLVGSDAALTRIGHQFSSASLLTGNKATRQAFGRQIRDHRVIQLFTHAEADSTGREPALFFADSSLRLSELPSAELLPVELVGLSACKTGVGAHQRGEGVFSLARGFASLGVPSVLTTLWNVESQATYDLTERFYAKLAEGLPKDLALQQAKLDYLASVDLSGQLPNRWAGLLLVGNTAPLQTNTGLDVWSLGLSALVLGGGYWWYRKRKRSSITY